MRSPLPAEVLAHARAQYGLRHARAQLDRRRGQPPPSDVLVRRSLPRSRPQGCVPARKSRRGIRTDMPRRRASRSRPRRQRTVGRPSPRAAANADRSGPRPRERTSRSALAASWSTAPRRWRQADWTTRDGRHPSASPGATRRRPRPIPRRPRPRVRDRAADRSRPRLRSRRCTRAGDGSPGRGRDGIASLRAGSRHVGLPGTSRRTPTSRSGCSERSRRNGVVLETAGVDRSRRRSYAPSRRCRPRRAGSVSRSTTSRGTAGGSRRSGTSGATVS